MKIVNEKKQSLTEKWSGQNQLSVADIKNSYVRSNTARLLENQRKGDLYTLLTEDFGMGVSGPTGLNQGIPNSGDGRGVFAPISMALVRRVFPNLFANVLVGVQPLNGPVGLAFALRNIYKTADPKEIVEAAWKSVPRFSGFSGSQANRSGSPDTGTGVETEGAEVWKLNGSIEEFTKTPELGLMLSKQAIVAKTRKLGASFSLESAEDIKRMQGIDMMSEMVKLLQYELTAEIDRETIGHCKSLTKPVIYKAAKPADFTEGSGIADGWIGRWSQERISNIITKLMANANAIHVATRRAPANIAVVSPSLATALQSAAPFFNKIAANVNPAVSTPEVGTLNGTLKVYVDPNTASHDGMFDTGEVLLAYKGDALNDCGVVYCPYVTGVINQAIDPNDFSPRIGVMSRYAFADSLLGAENYYRTLQFEGLSEKLLSTSNVW